MWIVLELGNGLNWTLPCMDDAGAAKVFDRYQDAEAERADCQEGLIVPVGGIGRRRLEATMEVRRLHPELDSVENWSMHDLEKTCSDIRRIAKGLLEEVKP